MRSDSSIAQHTDRDEILQRLLTEGTNVKALAQEKGIRYQALLTQRRKMRKDMGLQVMKTLPSRPPMVATGELAEMVGAGYLIKELALIKDRLNYEYLQDDATASTRINALDKSIRVVSELIRMAELAERHQSRSVRRTPEYQRLEKAIAATIRRAPELEAVFNEEYERLQPRVTDTDDRDTADE